MCEEMNLFRCGQLSILSNMQKNLQVSSVQYCQSEEKKLTCLEKYVTLERISINLPLFRIAIQNVETPHLGACRDAMHFVDFGCAI